MSKDGENQVSDSVEEAASESTDRDATVARLERAIAEERQHSAELRTSVSELEFKMGILERSYSKQLDDERARREQAEERIAEQGVRIVELDQAREDSIELLSETNIELDRLTKERDQLRRQLASRDGWQVEQPEEDFDDEGGTINALMNDASWIRRGDSEKAKREEKVPSEDSADSSPSEELISPDVVFVAGKSND